MVKKICITSADGETGRLTAELLLTNSDFSSKYDSLTCVALNADKCSELKESGANIITFDPKNVDDLAKQLKDAEIEAIYLIPPSHNDKFDLTMSLIEVSRKSDIKSVLFLSSAGCELADPEKQPQLRQFVEMEHEVLKTKGDTSTETGHSPCIIRAGYYAENLIMYGKQSKENGELPLPIGTEGKFAPVALGDVALLAAHVLTSEGPMGFGDNVRGQMITLTGPMMAAGNELATAAKDGAGLELEFKDISSDEAKELLDAQSDLEESEKEWMLEYYSLVKEGKTNYIATIAFNAVTGQSPMGPEEFFKTYAAEFSNKRRKMSK